MTGEWLPARFSLRSQVRSRRKGKCFETATNHIQNVKWNYSYNYAMKVVAEKNEVFIIISSQKENHLTTKY